MKSILLLIAMSVVPQDKHEEYYDYITYNVHVWAMNPDNCYVTGHIYFYRWTKLKRQGWDETAYCLESKINLEWDHNQKCFANFYEPQKRNGAYPYYILYDDNGVIRKINFKMYYEFFIPEGIVCDNVEWNNMVETSREPKGFGFGPNARYGP